MHDKRNLLSIELRTERVKCFELQRDDAIEVVYIVLRNFKLHFLSGALCRWPSRKWSFDMGGSVFAAEKPSPNAIYQHL